MKKKFGVVLIKDHSEVSRRTPQTAKESPSFRILGLEILPKSCLSIPCKYKAPPELYAQGRPLFFLS